MTGAMSTPLSYTPPGFEAERRDRGDVRRRHLVYVPGYDPEAKTRSRSLFVRELVRYAKRFGLSDRTVTPVEAVPDLPGLRWRVRTAKGDWATDTVVDVLRWDDIVERDFRRPVVLMVALMLVGMADYLVSGVVLRLFRMNWRFGCVIIYPFVMITALAAASLGLGYALTRLAWAWLPLPEVARVPAWIALAAGIVALASPLFARWYVWHLLQDWVFNWQHGNGRRGDYEARVDRFAAHLAALVRASDADEVVVVGHSSGSVMAVEIVARALKLDPDLGRHGPEVALLTVGSCVPLVAFNPRAQKCRDDIARVVTSDAVLWVEYQAPQDLLNSSGFNPLRDLPLGLGSEACRNPVIRSARFRDITTEKTYRVMVRSPFRMHFQFLMANERPGEYDYVLSVLGPTRLSERVRRPLDANARALGTALTDA